ncbi:MAG TPA: response regulator transcription factor [Chloroflexota bacterium]|nr:response regulator transcription factor [Chloroflexota bacterium]
MSAMADPATRVIGVLVCDDHPVVRTGLVSLISSQRQMNVVGEASTAEEAVRLAQELKPDVTIMDISMPGGGLEATAEIARLGIPTRVLILTVHAEERYLLPVLEVGGSGYVRKSSAHTDLLDAIHAVARGDVFLEPLAAKMLLRGYLERAKSGREADIRETLSERERDVARLTAEGFSANEIARQLFLSPKTVETYRQRVMQKLGLQHRSELVRYTLRAGLLDPDSIDR